MKLRAAALILGCSGLLLLRAPAQEDLDSLRVCHQTQRLIFENAFVRAIDDRIPPGASEPRHRHRHGVTIALSDYEVELQDDGAPVRRAAGKRGAVQWSPAQVHAVKNVGRAESHFVRIELK
jgi:hypothetical protein